MKAIDNAKGALGNDRKSLSKCLERGQKGTVKRYIDKNNIDDNSTRNIL